MKKKQHVNEAGRLKEAYKKTLADYEGSVEQIQYKKKLECDRRKQAAKAKTKQAARSPQSSPRKVKKRKDKRCRKQQMNIDSDSSSDSDSSDSGSSHVVHHQVVVQVVDHIHPVVILIQVLIKFNVLNFCN